jgi:hypothetical protein
MAKPDVIVETIRGISPAGEKRMSALRQTPPPPITVNFHGAQPALLDMSKPQAKSWAGIMDSVQRMKQAIYLEVDPETRVIAELLLPLPFKVAAVKPADKKDDVEVELVVSHARHYLRRANPGYRTMLAALKTAQKTEALVLVTESRDHQQIIDVRPVPDTVTAPPYLNAPLSRLTPGAAPSSSSQTRTSSGKGGAK